MSGYVGLHDKSSGKFGSIPDLPCNLSSEKNETLLKEIKRDLIVAEEECFNRGLLHSDKWISEMLSCLKEVTLDEEVYPESLSKQLGSEKSDYVLARSYFNLKEYDRAAYFSENCTRPIPRFVHLYSRYLSGEKKKNDDTVDPLMSTEQHNSPHLKELHTELSIHYTQAGVVRSDKGMEADSPSPSGSPPPPPSSSPPLDAYQLWLYGVVLKRLDLKKEATKVLCQSLTITPCHWGAWLELAGLVTDKEMLSSLSLPSGHWMHSLFLAHIYLELHMSEEASHIYSHFQRSGLHNSTYIKAQMVLAFHNLKDIDQAISLFQSLESLDPFRLESVDMYSNLLYVKEMRTELAHLAHRVTAVDKYRVETCCVVGNYYSLRGQHEKAVQYFQRALRLNPHYLAGWTLMGHEYMEMKNTNAAIQCYRQAIEVNSRDYRAWYGLGQTYEVLKLPAYCIYYYKQAHRLHPNDSRTLIALGDSFEKLEKWGDAKKCFHKAHSIGDVEDLALLRLARLYGHLGEGDRSAEVYERFLHETDETAACEERGSAFLFLAEHCLHKGALEMAYEYAHKCTLYPETRESGKTILNEIANKRQNEEHKNGDCSAVLSSLPPPPSTRFSLDADSPSTSRIPALSFSP